MRGVGCVEQMAELYRIQTGQNENARTPQWMSSMRMTPCVTQKKRLF